MDEINNYIIIIFRRGDYLNIKLNHGHTEILSQEKAQLKKLSHEAFESVFMYGKEIMVAKTHKGIFFYKISASKKSESWTLS